MVNFTEYKYFNLRNAAWDFLISNNINSLPTDLNAIAENNDWLLLLYESNLNFANLLDKDNLHKSCDGWTIIFNSINIIFYKSNDNLGRQRFTIAHELGHIVLSHLTHYKNELYEKEANMFARRILAPMGVLKACNINTSEEIRVLCSISREVAKYSFERYQLLLARNKFFTCHLEQELVKNFNEFITVYNKKHKKR